MTSDDILNILNLTTPTATPEAQPVLTYDGDLSDLPPGLGKKRAAQILALCEAGVPDGFYVHAGNPKLFKLTKLHNTFYVDEDSRIAGPHGKDDKGKHAIEWLAEKAGKVGPPPEEEVVAELPKKWKGDVKKVTNMFEKVDKAPEGKYINYNTSRAVEHNKDPAKETRLFSENYCICGDKKNKAEFLNLVAWLDEHPGAATGEFEKEAVESEAAEESVVAASLSSDEGEEESEVAEEESVAAEELSGDSKSESDTVTMSKSGGEGGEGDDDGTGSGDDDDEPSTTSPKAKVANVKSVTFAQGFNAKKLERLRMNIVKAKEQGKYANTNSTRPITRNDALEKKFEFDDEYAIAVPRQKNDVKTSWLKKEIIAMLDN